MPTTDRITRAAIYIRVSTDKQHTDNQRPAVLRLAEARGLEVVTIYEEQASSVKHRPQWEALKDAAHRGEFSALVIFAIDRLGRSMVGNVQEILQLDRLGVELVSVREPWLDTGGPVRSLLIAILSWVAEEERRQIASRSKLGVERARAQGKRIGRPPVVVDLDLVGLHRHEGLSLREVARKIGVPKSTLCRALAAVPKVPLRVDVPEVPILAGSTTS